MNVYTFNAHHLCLNTSIIQHVCLHVYDICFFPVGHFFVVSTSASTKIILHLFPIIQESEHLIYDHYIYTSFILRF